MARQTSTERHRHGHKHSKHKHKHKHKHGHHRHHHSSSKHKKKRSKEKKRDDTPEVQVNERDLQAALEKLDEAIIEQCVQSDDCTSSNTPSPSPLTPKPHLQESKSYDSHKSPSESISKATKEESLDRDEPVESTNETQTTSVNNEIECIESSPNVDEELRAQCDEKKMREERSAVNEEKEERKDDTNRGVDDRERSTSSSDSDDLQLGKDILETRNKKSIEIKIAGTTLPDSKSPSHTASGDEEKIDSGREKASSASEDSAEERSMVDSDNGGSEDEKRRRHSSHAHHKKKRRRHKKHSKRSRHSSSDSPYSSSRSPSMSRSRSRRSSSYSKRNRYSRSPSHSRRYTRSHSRSRSRSPYHSRSSRHHSRSPYRSDRWSCYQTRGWRSRIHNYTRSRFHSSGRFSRRGSGRYSRHYHSRSRSKSRSRSRSRSPYHHRRRRRQSYSNDSRSKSRSPDHSSRKDRSRSDDGNVVIGDVEIKNVVKEMATKVKQAHINQFTALCKDLQKKQEREDDGEQMSEPETQTTVRAPFEISSTRAYRSGLVLHNNVWKTPNQIVTENNVLQAVRPLTEKFPVSCGIEHQQKENTFGETDTTQDINVFAADSKPVPMGELIVKRLEATQRLQQNPQDMEAQQMLNYVEHQHQASAWVGSQIRPGKFTGKNQLQPLKPEDHKAGIQAWVKKDMFKGLAPVLSGFGIKVMKKMGWNEGQPLGRMGKGVTEPIPMNVKVDRAGLSSSSEKSQPFVPVTAIKASSATAKSAHLIQGKHPVSALQEICAKKHWDPPHYELVTDTGPSHHMSFCYKVILPTGSFQPAVASANKKQAKLQAALACLQALGFIENAL